MKNIVIFDEFNEIDFKPADLLGEYIRIVEEDVKNFLVKGQDLKAAPCPGCQSAKSTDGFEKFDLHYRECAECRTLYISPRPSQAALDNYYNQAQSRFFWQDKLLIATGKKRKEKIIKPRFEWILDSTQEHYPQAKHWVDVNTCQYGYIEEMKKNRFFTKKTLLNPYLSSNKIEAHASISFLKDNDWERTLKNSVDIVSLFEVADHVSDSHDFFKKIYSILKPGGLCFITAILASGFDLLTVWDQAENLYPPDRLNVFSVQGLKVLFKKTGFECLEFSTPGILDIDIVAKALKDNPDLPVSRFTKHIVNTQDEVLRHAFQEFLQMNLMSSYGRILIRKPR